MTPRLRIYTDIVSTIDDKVDRQWSDPITIRTPAELQAHGPRSVLFLPKSATELSPADKVMWITFVGAYILRGGEIQWTLR